MVRFAFLCLALTLCHLAPDEEKAYIPLDLPSGGRGEDTEEDIPEIIAFYGGDFEGDAFFWCLDQSGSMQFERRLAVLKTEVNRAIRMLSRHTEFSLVAFSFNHRAWSNLPRRATAANKISATGWVNELRPLGHTCIAPACIKTLEIAERSTRQRRTILLVGDGLPECPPPNSPEQNITAIEEITAANLMGIPIHTIYVAASDAGVNFMQTLAQANNGTFTKVP